jgi:anti-sigma regulatory factor (Ser/Thr protein kinase)
VRLPHDPDSIPAARAALDRVQPSVSTETWRNARLLVSELVTNSVRHADGEIELVVERHDGSLRVEVVDQGPGIDGLEQPPQREGGWGLQIVATVADRWGVEGDGHTRVWFELAA